MLYQIVKISHPNTPPIDDISIQTAKFADIDDIIDEIDAVGRSYIDMARNAPEEENYHLDGIINRKFINKEKPSSITVKCSVENGEVDLGQLVNSGKYDLQEFDIDYNNHEAVTIYFDKKDLEYKAKITNEWLEKGASNSILYINYGNMKNNLICIAVDVKPTPLYPEEQIEETWDEEKKQWIAKPGVSTMSYYENDRESNHQKSP